MLITKLFYVEMNIEDTDLTDDEIEDIQCEIEFSDCEIEEMIQERLEYQDYDSKVDVSVHEAWIQDGQLTYWVCSQSE